MIDRKMGSKYDERYSNYELLDRHFNQVRVRARVIATA